jgi:hypothetical protein
MAMPSEIPFTRVKRKLDRRDFLRGSPVAAGAIWGAAATWH